MCNKTIVVDESRQDGDKVEMMSFDIEIAMVHCPPVSILFEYFYSNSTTLLFIIKIKLFITRWTIMYSGYWLNAVLAIHYSHLIYKSRTETLFFDHVKLPSSENNSLRNLTIISF